MKNILIFICLIQSIIFSTPFQAISQCGGIMFTEYNSDDPDAFKFVALENLAEGLQINFTDNGWLSAGSFRTGEGTSTYTVPSGGISKGTVISPSVGSMQLSTSGDQIIAYTGTFAVPTIIAAIQMDGGVWQSDATSPNTSADPGAPNSLVLPEFDNAGYTGSVTSGTCAEILSALTTPSNWTTDNTTTGLSNVSSFILPIKLNSFELKKDLDAVKIQWSTSSEINNDYFTIEHTSDGKNFYPIGKVLGNGTSNHSIDYNFVHRNPNNGINYYRLRQTDFNGATELFPVKSIHLGRLAYSANIFPTITDDKLNINIEHNFGAEYDIYSLDGRKVLKGSLYFQNNEIDVKPLSIGNYFIRIIIDGQLFTERFVKQ